MTRVVELVSFPVPVQPAVTQVAAYARVSSDKDTMLHSLSAQVSYYSDMIQRHPDWKYCGVYSDEGLTGTKEQRGGFQRLLDDCRSGKIDLVITKSISRFARNTVTLLATVRELKKLGIDVFFEEQNIHSMSAEGELMMTLLASFAQEESRSASENQKWRVKKNFSAGIPWNYTLLGYRNDNGAFAVVPEEAEVIRWIFDAFLSGKSPESIARSLNEKGIPTRLGNRWHRQAVTNLLRNYAYTGNLLLQKTYSKDHMSKKKCENRGELPMYHVTDTHEAIIDLDTFNRAQAEIAAREKQYAHPHKSYSETIPLVRCGCCGRSCRRKITHKKTIWVCCNYNNNGKAACPRSKAVPDAVIRDVVFRYGGSKNIKAITACENNRLIIELMDGSEQSEEWKDRSRSESWTPEMRAEAGRIAHKKKEKS